MQRLAAAGLPDRVTRQPTQPVAYRNRTPRCPRGDFGRCCPRSLSRNHSPSPGFVTFARAWCSHGPNTIFTTLLHQLHVKLPPVRVGRRLNVLDTLTAPRTSLVPVERISFLRGDQVEVGWGHSLTGTHVVSADPRSDSVVPCSSETALDFPCFHRRHFFCLPAFLHQVPLQSKNFWGHTVPKSVPTVTDPLELLDYTTSAFFCQQTPEV